MRTGKFIWMIGVLCLLLASPSLVLAGTTGKVMGTVLDGSGGPLPGANVVLVGTQRGATSDADGFYVIVSVDPGIYSVAASMVGYEKQTKTEVEVRADFTSEVNFGLKEATIEAAELVVIAERPPVEVDKTSSKYVVGAAEIEEVPIVRETQDMIALQPGADIEGGEILRSSDVNPGSSRGAGNDVIYYVDGVQMTHSNRAQYRRGIAQQTFSGVQKTAVQEITVIAGGMEAEYGNAQGGIISVVTKDAAQSFHGWSEYRYTPSGKKHWGANVYDSPIHKGHMKWGDSDWENERDPVTGRLVHPRVDYTEVAGHEVEANVSGPLSGNAGFMVSGRWVSLASPLPGPTETGIGTSASGFVAAPKNINLTYNVSFRPTQNLKVKVGGILRRFKRYVDRDVSYWVEPGLIRGLGDSGRNIFLPEEWSASGRQVMTDDSEYLTITHTVSPRTFYEVRIGRISSVQDTSDVPPRTGNPRKDKDGWFNVDREIRQFELTDNKSYQLKADFSSQITKGHFVKGGIDIVKHKIWTTRITHEKTTFRRIELAGKNGVKMGEPAGPMIGAAYVQDKMEFEGMVVNVGLRWDFLAPSDKVPVLPHFALTPMYLSYQRFQNVALKEPGVLQALSPRLGVSHPITARSMIHFFIGRFTQWPNLYNLYNQDWMSTGEDVDWNGNGKIDEHEIYNSTIISYPVRGGNGSVNFKPESTVNFEVGFDWNFVADYVAAMTMFYKSETDQHQQLGSSILWPGKKRWGPKYVRYQGEQRFEDIRGLEMSIRKRMSNNFSFSVAYNLRWHTEGRAGWFRNEVIPDSIWVVTPYDDGKPRYYDEFKVENGREVPVYPTADELAEWGSYANRVLASEVAKRNQSLSRRRYFFGTIAPMNVYGWRGRDKVDEEHLWVRPRAYSGGINPKGDVRNSGSFRMLYMTPPDFGPAVNVFGSPVLANWRANLIYRIHTGSNFWYTPPNATREPRYRAPRTWTDLHVEKTFPTRGGGDVSLFLQVYNLFDQKDSSTSGFDYIQWGLQKPRPDNPDYVAFGDTSDRTRYYGKPRELTFGIRASF